MPHLTPESIALLSFAETAEVWLTFVVQAQAYNHTIRHELSAAKVLGLPPSILCAYENLFLPFINLYLV